MLVFCQYTVVYSAIEGNTALIVYVCRCILRPEIYMLLRRSLASLARAYKLHVYMIFFLSVGTFGGLPPPPPNTKKLATLLAKREGVSVVYKNNPCRM